MTLEDWNTFFQFGSAILLGLTFLFGAGAIWSSWRVGNRLSERIATTEGEAAAANERAGSLELEAAEQREKAAKAERELLELQQRLSPRALSAQQRERLAAQLNRFAGQRLDIFMFGETPEIAGIAAAITETVEAAGWKTMRWSASDGVVRGIVVVTREGVNSVVDAADAIVAGLRTETIDTARGRPFTQGDLPSMLLGPPFENEKAAPIRMLIGTKP